MSAEDFMPFSRKTYFNHSNLIKCRNTAQKGKILSSECHGPASKWAGCYLNCEVMCTPTVQMSFLKHHIIMKLMAGKICCITSCKKWDTKPNVRKQKDDNSLFSLKANFLLFPKWRSREGRKVNSKDNENLRKVRISTTKSNKKFNSVS